MDSKQILNLVSKGRAQVNIAKANIPKIISVATTSAVIAILSSIFNVNAQTVDYVTLNAAAHNTNQYAIKTNQIVAVVGVGSFNSATPILWGNYSDGTQLFMLPSPLGSQQIATGLTNLAILAGTQSTWATFQITTPASTTTISNYVPADAIVIPANATGNVQIILESSIDLVNWNRRKSRNLFRSIGNK